MHARRGRRAAPAKDVREEGLMTQPTVAGWVSTEFRRTPWGGGDDEALLPRRLSGSPAASAVADAEDVAGIERAFHRARQLEPGLQAWRA